MIFIAGGNHKQFLNIFDMDAVIKNKPSNKKTFPNISKRLLCGKIISED